MTGDIGPAKWTGKVLLHVPLFCCFSMLTVGLIHAAFRLLRPSEVSAPDIFLTRHFLLVSAVGGLIAGLWIKDMCRRTGLLTASPEDSPGHSPWLEPQAWIWTVFTCFLLLGIVVWLEETANHSALAASSGITKSGFINTFVGSECQFPQGDVRAYLSSSCLYEGLFTNLWIAAVGYSAATFVSSRFLSRLHLTRSTADIPCTGKPLDHPEQPQQRKP